MSTETELRSKVLAAFRAAIEAKARPTVDELAAALHAEGVGCWSPRSVCPGPPEHHVRSAGAVWQRLAELGRKHAVSGLPRDLATRADDILEHDGQPVTFDDVPEETL